jgi:hypothetical protein
VQHLAHAKVLHAADRAHLLRRKEPGRLEVGVLAAAALGNQELQRFGDWINVLTHGEPLKCGLTAGGWTPWPPPGGARVREGSLKNRARSILDGLTAPGVQI